MSTINYPINTSLGTAVHAFPKVQYAKIVEIIDAVNAINSGTVSLTDVQVADGTAAAPSITFSSDSDTGIYRVGANDIGITTGGTLAVDISDTAVTSALPVLITNSTASTSTITGSTIISGGVGIAKELFVSTTTPLSVSATGVLTVTNATDATTSTTGSVKLTGGLGVAKALYVGTSVNAATFVTSGNGTVSLPAIGPVADTDTGLYFPSANTIGVAVGGVSEAVVSSGSILLTKEINHSISVDASTTAATAGATLTVSAGNGNTSGAGGTLSLVAGNSGATVGTTGGNIVLQPGSSTSTTVSPIVVAKSNIARAVLGTGTVATGATVSAKAMVDGYFGVTGDTGNVQMATAADIITALGFTPVAGTSFDFVVNATNMTAGNVATLTVNTGVTFLKQVSAGDSASSVLATVTQTAGTHIGMFKVIFDSTSTCVVTRIG